MTQPLGSLGGAVAAAPSEYDQQFDELRELEDAERKRLAAHEDPAEDPEDVPATKLVQFRWFDTLLGRVQAEPFEIRLMTHKERIWRGRTVGLMSQVSWHILPEDVQTTLLGIATSNILWPNASESWKRTILERPEVAMGAYTAVEEHRQEYFRRHAAASGQAEIEMGLEVRPVPVAKPVL